MSKFNFDSEFFRRVISKSDKTEKLSLLSHMIKEAVELFYDEYDYYPEIAAYAPGSFTIMGDHLEYVKGNLVQGGLPMVTVVVGKSLSSVKCRLITTSTNVQGLRKSIFPIYNHYKKNLKVYPEWVNYVKGAINCFPYGDQRGFDAVIHSNIPVCQGYGSSSALQVGVFTFLEACMGRKSCEKKVEKGSLCQLAERPSHEGQYKMGQWNNFTAAVAVENALVKIDCRTREVSTFDIRDIDILFLLTYPNFEIEVKDRDLVPRRQMELKLIGELLGLEDVIDATERDLQDLANMEDPTRETVEKILHKLGYNEAIINQYLDELFYFPVSDSVLAYDECPDEVLFEGESMIGEEKESIKGEDSVNEKVMKASITAEESEKQRSKESKAPPVSYLQQRIVEICLGRSQSGISLPKRICDEIICLGGVENLSVASDMTVCGKLIKRLRHIISENMRSLALADALCHMDYVEFGSKLIQSHLSLKLDYEVSCPTLDSLVQLAIETDRVYGAKMTSGGGTLTLVMRVFRDLTQNLHRSAVENYIDKVTERFPSQTFQFYLVFPSSGAKIVSVGAKRNPKSSLSQTFPTAEELLKSAIENFQITYQYSPTHGAFSPGNLTLLGDNADCNHGFCISVAVNMTTVVVGAFNGTSKVRACTTADVDDRRKNVVFPLPYGDDMKSGNVKWANIVRGVVVHFKGELRGFDCLIESSFPRHGVGCTSALVVAIYTFLEELTGKRVKKSLDKAYYCTQALQEFNMVLSGINDQLVPIRAKKDTVNLVDCRSNTLTFIPFHDPSVTLLLTFIEPKDSSSKSVLFTRMEECYDVARALGGKTLRCLNLKDLDVLKCTKIKRSSIRRAQHVIKENARALKAAEAFKNNDYEALGELLVESHNSLRDEFEMSRPELDHLVKCAMEVDGVLGSKMCSNEHLSHTVSLVKRWAVDDLIEYQQKNYSGAIWFYVVGLHERCNSMNVKEYVDAQISSRYVFEDIFPF